MHTYFWLENLKGRDHTENLHVCVKVTGVEGVDWMHLAENRDWW
jgi:hypothetical protein